MTNCNDRTDEIDCDSDNTTSTTTTSSTTSSYFSSTLVTEAKEGEKDETESMIFFLYILFYSSL